jgi:acetyl-CoA acetyltransferase
MTLKDQVAVVGLGTVQFGPDEAKDLGAADLAILAAEAALDDAGLTTADLQCFAWSSGASDPGALAAAMGVPEVTFSANLTSAGGGGAGSLALAASSIVGGFGDVCLSIVSARMPPRRPGHSSLRTANPVAGGGAYGGRAIQGADDAFWKPADITTQGASMAIVAARYMHEHGITRQQLGELVVSQRANAGDTLTLDEYLAAPLVVGPLSLLDGTPDFDCAYAAAMITTTSERAADMPHPVVLLSGAATGGTPSHARPFQMPDDSFATSGHRDVARDLYERAGIGAGDIDVALLYDDFSPQVLMQLEDYRLCDAGGAGAFVGAGNAKVGGSLPVNTHGGNLSSAAAAGANHVFEAVQQLRGTSSKQVDGAEVALVTGSPATIPLSAAILRRA